MFAASAQTSFGLVLLFLSVLIAFMYAFLNIRMSRAELGSEIELAPNRKPYYSDEELEGKRLDRTLTIGMVGLLLVSVAVPVYWLMEPGRQAGARDDFKAKFVKQGALMFDTTANGGFNCAFCHGGMKAEGGIAPFTITDSDGQFVKQVNWKAPALNLVLSRFDRTEVRYILTYGRTFSPMPAWGIDGGGPMNDQQIQNLVDYLESIQIDLEDPAQREELRGEVQKALQDEKAAAASAGSPYASDGEALFNLGYYTNYGGGQFACGRCHTTGWSYNQKGADGNGALGPSLRGSTGERFPGAVKGFENMTNFVCAGSAKGINYGVNGQGTGRMPSFCQVPAETDNVAKTGEVGVVAKDPSDPLKVGGMFSHDQVEEIVRYVRGL